jgi:hypothetical protein
MRARSAAIGLGEVDVRDLRARSLEKRRGAAPGVVDDLVRHHQRRRDRTRCRMPPTVADAAICFAPASFSAWMLAR